MLYTFESAATASVLMLEAPARQLLQALHKTPGQPGIVTVVDMPLALQRLSEAATANDAERQAEAELAKAENRAPRLESVSLRMRMQPLADMLKRSQAEEKPVTWRVG